MESSGTGTEDQSNSGPSPTSNPFDLVNILGSSPFTGSLSSAAAIYPPLAHIPSAFSMLEPHPMFPGAAVLPFGGLGSLGEGLMSAGVLGHALGSAGNSADWWRAASEQANHQITPDSIGPNTFYTGINGMFGSPLFSPLFSPCITTPAVTTSSSSGSESRSSVLLSSKLVSSKSHKQYTSSPIPKDYKDSHRRKEQKTEAERGGSGGQENSRLMSPAKSSGKCGAMTEGTVESVLKNNSLELDYSLENSLLSAEAALYSASPFFFPFGAMAALSSAFGGMPFPSSSSMYSCTAASPAHSSPFTIFPRHSSTSTSKMSTRESPVSQKSKSESRTWTPASRMSSSGTTSGTPVANTPGANTPVSPGTPQKNRNVTVSPCEVAKKSGDHRKESFGTGTSVIVSRVGSTSSAGSSARTLSIADHKIHLSGKGDSVDSNEKDRSHISLPQKVAESKLRKISKPDNMCNTSKQSKNCEKNSAPCTDTLSDLAKYSLDGAIDLSVKKPRTESPAWAPAVCTKSHMLSKSSDCLRNSTAAGSFMSSSQADVLSALAHSHQVYAEHQAQLLANNQMAAAAAAAGLTDPLSFNLAAAALLPQMYDGMTGLFYPPSALAAMAAATGVMSNVSPTEKTKTGRGRGRKRCLSGQQSSSRNRGRTSSLFISSLMPLSDKMEEVQEKGKGWGGETAGVATTAQSGERKGGGGRGKSGRSRMLSAPLPCMDSEEQRHQQEFLHQRMESEMQQQQHHHQLKLLQKMHHKKQSLQSGTSADGCTGVFGSISAEGHQVRRETLTTKLQHHQSKLAQALMGQDGLMTTSSAVLGSPLFQKTDLLDHQMTSTEYESSIRTDSDLNDESSSSECSGSESESGGESQSTRGSEGENSTQSVSRSKRKLENADGGPRKKRQRTILDEAEIRIPLDHHGWQRETMIHSFTPKKIVGEVVYITPCGKKMHNCYEVDKYLEKDGIKDLNQENFTFSTKVNLGKFYELNSGEVPGYSQMTEAEVVERYIAVEARKKRIKKTLRLDEQHEEHHKQTEELSLKMAEARLQKKFEQQALDLKKSKEKQKMMRQQDKFHRQQQIKLERDARSQQINEEKEVKRQQSLILKEQERERRRQQVLLIKAMEAKKKKVPTATLR